MLKRTLLFGTFIFGITLNQVQAGSSQLIEETLDLPGVSNNNSSEMIIEESIDLPNISDNSEQISEQEIVLNNGEESKSYIETTSFKLGNGLFEIVTCVLEFPKTIIRTSREDGWTSGLTLGLVKGAANTVEQAVSGAVNVATFPVPQELELDVLGDDVHDEMDFSMEQTFGAAFGKTDAGLNTEDDEIFGSDIGGDNHE